VTQHPITAKPTKQCTERGHHDSQTHHRSTSYSSYQPQPRIKSRTAYPCIMIRRTGKSRKADTMV
jgi:hypothetical protein